MTQPWRMINIKYLAHSNLVVKLVLACCLCFGGPRARTSGNSSRSICLATSKLFSSAVAQLLVMTSYTRYNITEHTHTHTHIHPFNGPFSGTTRVGQYQKGKTNLDFTEARDSEWQWHQLGHMQVYTSLQADNHASTPPLSFLQAGCLPAAQPTASKH